MGLGNKWIVDLRQDRNRTSMSSWALLNGKILPRTMQKSAVETNSEYDSKLPDTAKVDYVNTCQRTSLGLMALRNKYHPIRTVIKCYLTKDGFQR
jgi:hypothetical protein